MKPKQMLYKTAYAPMYGAYVGIKDCWQVGDVWYYRARPAGTDDVILFSEFELTNFVL